MMIYSTMGKPTVFQQHEQHEQKILERKKEKNKNKTYDKPYSLDT